jgi:hypothetical protein
MNKQKEKKEREEEEEENINNKIVVNRHRIAIWNVNAVNSRGTRLTAFGCDGSHGTDEVVRL